MTHIAVGGYQRIKEDIIRSGGINKHTAQDLSNIGQTTLDALNLIQSTPWAVNKFTLNTINNLANIGKDVGYHDTSSGEFEVVFRFQKPEQPILQTKSLNQTESMQELDWKDYNTQKRKRLSKFESNLGVYRSTRRIVDLANEMSEHDVFYYPHALDFRTRIYPIPTDLTPQGNDLSKGLLRFARGKKLGTEGVYWLGVMVASHFGYDKLSLDERFRKASDPDFFSTMCRVVNDPIKNREWIKADAPLQFLAVANEWVTAMGLDDPKDFISYLPGSLDGSCNGMQHLSIMARDTVGATATNCRSIEERNDLYQEVAERVYQAVEADAHQGNSLAIEVLPRLLQPSGRRNVVKRATMTQSYGVTDYGITQFMIDDDHVSGLSDEFSSARYLQNKIVAALDTTLSKGRALQTWFKTMAQRCAQNGKPFIFDTPAGSRIVMAYYRAEESRIKTLNTKFVVYNRPSKGETQEEFYNRVGLNVQKMESSASPNFVHAHDAAHLQLTVVEMSNRGINDFCMIHDSFGCPMSQVGIMRDALRQQIVKMYEGDCLERIKNSVEYHSGLKMPEPPEIGDFDINEILQSEYFFS